MRRAVTATSVLYSRPVQLRLAPSAYVLRGFASKVPGELKYTKSHEWVKVTDGVATVGITDHAQEALGEVVFVDLPSAGTSLAKEESFGAVESVKTVSDVYAPVSGEVAEVNEDLRDKEKVAAINSDPYGNGWMIKLKLTNKSELDGLLDAKAYKEHCDAEAH